MVVDFPETGHVIKFGIDKRKFEILIFQRAWSFCGVEEIYRPVLSMTEI